MSKRGLSDVVTTVLLILLVLASVVIIWNFVQPLVRSAGNLDTQKFTTKLSVPESSVYLDPNSQTLSLSIKRDAGDGDVTGFVFGIEDPSGAVRTFRQNFTLNEYELRNFEVNYSQFMIDDVVSVTVTPIFRNNNTGEETFGQPIQQPVKNKTSFKLPNGLVAHWKFDGNLVDSINGLNGGAVGAATFDYTNKKVGQASGSFGGTSGTYVQIANNNQFNGNEFTIVAWAYPKLLSGSSTSTIADKSSIGNGFRLRYDLSSNSWQFHTFGSYTNLLNLSQSNSINNWNFVAASINSQNQKALYYGSQSNFTTTTTYATPAASTSLRVGQFWNGNIDEVMFFNRALTAQEISDIRTKYK